MNWISSFLNPGKGYEKGQAQLDKYYSDAQGYQQPYNQNGQDQYKNLQSYIDNLMHPEKLQGEWIKGYSESPNAKQAETMANEHGMNAAYSMGLGGSNTALNAIQSGTTQIGLDDRQNYLDNMMQKYLAGAGLVQGAYGTGANAAGQMGQNAMNMGQNSAQMAYGQQNAGGNMLSSLIGGGLGLLGGPIGGALAKRWNLSGGK